MSGEAPYQILLFSYDITSGTLAPSAIHNEIVFLNQGVPCALNGDAWDRNTGQTVDFSLIEGRPLMARASSFNMQITNSLVHSFLSDDKANYKLVETTELWRGQDNTEFLEHMHRAAQAAHHINEMNLNYSLVGGIFNPAQNSNSVASTLMKAMGFEYPESLKNMWAPGKDTILFPVDEFFAVQEADRKTKSVSETAVYDLMKDIDPVNVSSKVSGQIQDTKTQEFLRGMIFPECRLPSPGK